MIVSCKKICPRQYNFILNSYNTLQLELIKKRYSTNSTSNNTSETDTTNNKNVTKITNKIESLKSKLDKEQIQNDNADHASNTPFKKTERSSRFGIESKVAAKIPRYQARLQESTIQRVYAKSRSVELIKKVKEFFNRNDIPKDLPRKEKFILIIKKYGNLYFIIIVFWISIVFLYKSVTNKYRSVLKIDDWSEYLKDSIYTARAYFRVNGRIPMSINAAAVKLSNNDILLYNPVPPSHSILKFLFEFLLLNRNTQQEDENRIQNLNLEQNLNQYSNRILHIIVPNDVDTSFASDYFEYSNPKILKIHYYVYEKNMKFINQLKEWIEKYDKPLEVSFISSPEDFPDIIKKDFDIKIVNELTNLNEIVLYHRSSNVAIMGDITQNVVYGKTLPTDFTGTRFFENIMYFNGDIGIFGRIRPKSIVSNDYQALLKKMESIAIWNFNGVIMSCGEVIHPNEMPNVNIEFLKRWMGVLAKKSNERAKEQHGDKALA